ncbi:MAG: hypothetical protein IPN29_05865 [Saprospiraceae bacterium]|nr:hypothetical protein [Saprospiraceae bacterium]
MKYKRSFRDIVIMSLLFFLGINAIGGGIYGLMGAKDVPLNWLESSPFKDYFIPSLFLLVVVAGSCLGAGVMVWKGYEHARKMTLLCGILLMGWIGSQLSIIGYVSVLQPSVLIAGLLLVVLGARR